MKILIAEDDPLTLEALSTCIEAEGYSTILAKDGREAVQRWRDHNPDLVCLDIMMPEMNGYDACKRIRSGDKELPILFLSAKNEEADIVSGLNLGADDFIRKPFRRLEVLARIRAALRRVASYSVDTFSFGDLLVEPSALCAKREGLVIDLTPREVSILELLSQNQGLPVSRDTLLDKCWGMDYFPNSRTLDQHILTLRKKIEKDPAKPDFITTVRGVGYRYM